MTTIRVADSKDIPKLIEMGEKLFEFEKQYEPLTTFSPSEAIERYTQQMRNPNTLFLVAEEVSEIVGYLYAHADKVEYLSTQQLECEIEVIYVEPYYRGQGIAQKLITECVAWAKTKDAFRIKSGIYAENQSSQAAFNKFGFKPHHVTHIYDLVK